MIFYFHFIICRSVNKEGRHFIISANDQFRVLANKVIFSPFLAKSNQMWGKEGHWLGNTSSGLQSLLAVTQYDHLSTKYWESGKYWENWEILGNTFDGLQSLSVVSQYDHFLPKRKEQCDFFFQC